MILKPISCAAALALLTVSCAAADSSQASSINQGLQLGAELPQPNDATAPDSAADSIPTAAGDADDDSFGSQQILKRVEKIPLFDVFAGVSALYTNNVALTRKDARGDAFLVATFGLSTTRKITDTLELDLSARGGMFRYAKYNQFDLDTMDFGVGLSYRMPKLWDASLYLDYDFTGFFNGRTEDEFFENHGITLGAQKAISLSRAQSVIGGISAEWNISHPLVSQRDDYGAYLEYHLDLTSRLAADLFYRYAYEVYSVGDRRDENHSLTLSLQYNLNAFLAVSVSTFLASDHSNDTAYSYLSLATGAGLSGNIRF